jgi:hypothetical protein
VDEAARGGRREAAAMEREEAVWFLKRGNRMRREINRGGVKEG